MTGPTPAYKNQNYTKYSEFVLITSYLPRPVTSSRQLLVMVAYGWSWNEGVAHVREAEVVVAHDIVWTEIAQVRNS